MDTQKAKLKIPLESCSCKYLDFLVAEKNSYEDVALMDLLKAFDTLNHHLLTAKLHAYSFSKEDLKSINSCSIDHCQRTKTNTRFSRWPELILPVPQESVLGPRLLFA